MNSVTLALPSELHEIDSECVLWLCAPADINAAISTLPVSSQVFVKQVLDDEAFTGAEGQSVLLHRPVGLAAKRWLIFGVGDLKHDIALSFDHHSANHGTRQLFVEAFKRALSTHSSTITLVLPYHFSQPSVNSEQVFAGKNKKKTTEEMLISQLLRAFYFGCYQFKGYKSSPHLSSKEEPALTISAPPTQPLLTCLKYENSLANGMQLARDLSHMPANICTPMYLAEQATRLASNFSAITSEIINQSALEALSMNAYLAVNRASAFPASMPVIHYSGRRDGNNEDDKNAHPVVLIGKGVTFDSGGVSLKRGSDMHHMIYDMAGAACVLGVISAAAELGLNINIIGILATAENSIGGNAYRPGDIITTHSKQTVEIISTDAEGRMLICDALSYSEQFSPQAIIDIATLTGAAITALGHKCSSVMSNSRPLEQALIKAGEESQDPVWPFPIWPEYQEAIASSHADMANAGKNSPGMITAGCFLSRFSQGFPWAHLDVAGTAFKHGTANSATGRPIPLLLTYLQRLASSRKSS